MKSIRCERVRQGSLGLRCLLFFLSAGLAVAGPEMSGKNPPPGKGPVVVPEPMADWGGPLFGGGAKSNDEFTEGNLFLVYPWMNTIGTGATMEGSVGFLEPYFSWGDDAEIGVTLGAGFRHLFSDQSPIDAARGGIAGPMEEGFYVGANSFFDYLQSPNDSDFYQVGFGVETGTRYVELRANYYYLLSDEEIIDRRTETSVSSSTSTSRATRVGAPTTSGGRIVQGVSQTTTRRTTTTTQRRTFETFEEPLEGWDIEMAVLMPFIDQYCDLQLVGGYYEYTGDRSRLPTLSGWRAGVEFRPVPALALHATWYENERLYQDEWMIGFRVELPLDGSWKDSFTPRRRHLAERLFEPVSRKNASVTTNGTEEVQTSTSSTTTTETTQSTSSSTRDLGAVPRRSKPVIPDPDPPAEMMPPEETEMPK